jgi:predicted transcriptional regulator of viral defense system
MQTKTTELLEIARTKLLRVADVRRAGLPTSLLSRLVAQGRLARVGRGVYRHPEAELDENESLSVVAAQVPNCVVVLLSALRFHRIGTHSPNAVWIQRPVGTRPPAFRYPPVEIVYTRLDKAFEFGVEAHQLNGVEVLITTPARTIADCFKHREKIGLEACLEALREIVPTQASAAEVLKFSKMVRVESVMLPYLEILV